MRLPGSRKCSSGFTLIELIVVVTVISILTSIALVSFNSIQASARDAQRQQNITAIQTALERYYGEYQTYPEQSNWGNVFTFGNDRLPNQTYGICGGVSWGAGTPCATGYFLSNIPRDPKCPTIAITNGVWTPCGGTRPSYSYSPSACTGSPATYDRVCSNYTITLQKESGGTVTFTSPQ